MDEMSVVRQHKAESPVDVVGLIHGLGIAYVEEPLGPGNSGRINFDGTFCTITVNSEESEQRRRFTAAHEVGHYLMHRDLLQGRGHLDRLYENGGQNNPYSPLSPRHEVQANRFAADLLMPANTIRRLYTETGGDERQISRILAVSPAAVRVRLRALGLGFLRRPNAH